MACYLTVQDLRKTLRIGSDCNHKEILYRGIDIPLVQYEFDGRNFVQHVIREYSGDVFFSVLEDGNKYDANKYEATLQLTGREIGFRDPFIRKSKSFKMQVQDVWENDNLKGDSIYLDVDYFTNIFASNDERTGVVQWTSRVDITRKNVC